MTKTQIQIPPRDILVVDDEQAITMLLERILKRLPEPPPVVIHRAVSAEQALDLLEQRHFDLVLTDYNMGGRDGVSLLTTVKERWPDTHRVLMTGYTDEQIYRDAVEKGAVAAFIRKPWSNQDLLRTIGAILPPLSSSDQP